MPLRTVPDTDPVIQYYLIAFDEEGRERREPDGSLMSEKALKALRDEPVTDVFMMSHGWRGDVPKAVKQYDAWTKNLMDESGGRNEMTARRPSFRPLLVGLHWPSEPWGDEDISGSFAIGAGGAATVEEAAETAAAEQASRLSADAAAEEQLRTIYRAYATLDNPETMPPEVENAYRKLNELLHLPTGDEAAAPGDDRPAFDPNAIFEAAKRDEEVELLTGSFGSLGWGRLLAPLRVLSFWRMKNRARSFGEGGAHGFLLAMQSETSGRDVRFHLMGHSFGCIVMTGAAAGPSNDISQRKPVQSMVLVQGALSLWAYSESMQHSPGKPGYFRRLIAKNRCEGPIVTTFSQFDKAVGKAYPLAAGLAQQESFAPAELPKYGGIGTFGIQGISAATARNIGGAGEDYKFRGGQIYNLNAQEVISGNQGQHDAHSDIVHPEVAHVIWQAALPQ
jgi:hypothetical protein